MASPVRGIEDGGEAGAGQARGGGGDLLGANIEEGSREGPAAQHQEATTPVCDRPRQHSQTNSANQSKATCYLLPATCYLGGGWGGNLLPGVITGASAVLVGVGGRLNVSGISLMACPGRVSAKTTTSYLLQTGPLVG